MKMFKFCQSTCALDQGKNKQTNKQASTHKKTVKCKCDILHIFQISVLNIKRIILIS